MRDVKHIRDDIRWACRILEDSQDGHQIVKIETRLNCLWAELAEAEAHQRQILELCP